ncbi:MAG: MFS transporter [Actinomycetaceae bacterium]|nr:MFS transporter [Actinomycetaceae bacterium]
MNKVVKKWILLGFLISLMDQFYFVCLNWILFSSFSVSVASSLLTLLSFLRLLGLLISPLVARRSGSLYCVSSGLVGRTVSFLLTFVVLTFSKNWILYIIPLCLFAISDGILIPASSMVLREISLDEKYVTSLGGMQIALNLSLALSALFGGSALMFLSPSKITLILLVIGCVTLFYFLKVKVGIIDSCQVSITPEYFSIVSYFKSIRKIPNVLRILLQIFILELMLAGSLNILLPSHFAQAGYGSLFFSVAICLFVFGGIMGGLLLQFYKPIVDYHMFYPVALLVLSIAFFICIFDLLPIYLCSFFIFGVLGSLIAPFLTNRFISSADGVEGVLAFSAFSLFSYGAILVSYALFSLLLSLVNVSVIFAFISFLFLALAILNMKVQKVKDR